MQYFHKYVKLEDYLVKHFKTLQSYVEVNTLLKGNVHSFL